MPEKKVSTTTRARNQDQKEKREESVDVEKMDVEGSYSLVDPIDRLPKINYDEEKIIKIFTDNVNEIDSARSEWMGRKYDYLHQWDDYIEYDSGITLRGQKNVHIPVTHEKIQAWQSRMYNTIFSMDPFFSTIPTSIVSMKEVESVKTLLRWYMYQEINRRNGFKPFVSEMLWDLGTDGWAIGYKNWITIERMMVDLKKIDKDVAVEEMKRLIGSKKKDFKEFKEIKKIVQAYSGVEVSTIPHEMVYFPGYIPTSGDMNYPELVIIEREYTEEQLISYKNSRFFDADAVDKIIEGGSGSLSSEKDGLKKERERLQGVQEAYYDGRGRKKYQLLTGFLRKDIEDEGYPQEYIFTVSAKAKKVARATYLDRVCRNGDRPVYKFDLLKRPRSSYSRGFVELLFPLNQEIDEYHNLRRASGKISSIPWGFYRAASGLEKEAIEIKPGSFFPVDEPSDVQTVQFGNKTSYFMQEEALAQRYADSLTSMPSMMQGQIPEQVGPLRSTSGLTAIMNETQMPMNLYLDQIRGPLGKIVQGVLSDLIWRLPDPIWIMVLGNKGNLIYGDDGNVLHEEIPKKLISSTYRFDLSVNNAQYNPQREKEESQLRLQMGLSQFPVQMGLTTPQNAYFLLKDFYERTGIVDIDQILTQPKMVIQPLTVFHEYNECIAGRLPIIVLNDNHDEKIKAMTRIVTSKAHQEGLASGKFSPITNRLIEQTLSSHANYSQIIKSLPKNTTNPSGANISNTLGSNVAGRQNIGGQNVQNPNVGSGVASGKRTGKSSTPRLDEERTVGKEE